MICGNGISEYVIRLGLSQAMNNLTIGSNFSSKRVLVSEYFGGECCKISEPESVKKYRVEPECKISHSTLLVCKQLIA